jgi:hypothetical protein
LWRADGKRFLISFGGEDRFQYSYAPDAGPMNSSMSEEEIKGLIRERLTCKLNRDFDAADSIKADLEDVGVYVDDRNKLWRADGKTFFDLGGGHSYDDSQRRYKNDSRGADYDEGDDDDDDDGDDDDDFRGRGKTLLQSLCCRQNTLI